jgi:hypothetical protein
MYQGVLVRASGKAELRNNLTLVLKATFHGPPWSDGPSTPKLLGMLAGNTDATG